MRQPQGIFGTQCGIWAGVSVFFLAQGRFITARVLCDTFLCFYALHRAQEAISLLPAGINFFGITRIL
jgi:hypothetical protein